MAKLRRVSRKQRRECEDKYVAETVEDSIRIRPGWENGHSVQLCDKSVGSRMNIGETGNDRL